MSATDKSSRSPRPRPSTSWPYDADHLGKCAATYVDLWTGCAFKYWDFVAKSSDAFFDAMSPDSEEGLTQETKRPDEYVVKLAITNHDARGTLKTEGFMRRETVTVISPDQISFDPPVLKPGATSVLMRIKTSAIPIKRALLRANVFVSANTRVCDTVTLNTPIGYASGD